MAYEGHLHKEAQTGQRGNLPKYVSRQLGCWTKLLLSLCPHEVPEDVKQPLQGKGMWTM